MSEVPVELIYKRLWQVLDGFKGSGVKVRPGNLVDYSKLRPRDKGGSESSADMPEIKCALSGSSWDTGGTTSSEEGEIQRFDLVVATGELQLIEQLRLKWFVRQKLWDAKSIWQSVTYRGEMFCRRVQYVDVFEGLRENAERTKLIGWTSVISLEAYMKFSRKQMTFKTE